MTKLESLLKLIQEMGGGGGHGGGGAVGHAGGRIGHPSGRKGREYPIGVGYWGGWGPYCPVGTKWNPSTGKCEKV